jgi:type II secretory pathway pseudopilin PulG
MKQKLSQTGFTLLELLLYVAIVGMLLLALAYFFVGTASTRIGGQIENDVNQQATFAMETITQTIRNSDSITAPAANVSGAQLTLAMTPSTVSPTIFALSSGVLTIKEGAGTVVPLTSSSVVVSNLTFSNASKASTPGSVQISFTMASSSTSNRSEFSYSKTFTTTASVRQ